MKLAKVLNVSLDNVDVFTVLHSHHNANRSVLDVRFSAHGSPYYHPERLNYMASMFQDQVIRTRRLATARNSLHFYAMQFTLQIEKDLGLEIVMINIDECLIEKASCETSCVNFLNKSKIPHSVFTNTSSFVGVGAVVDPYCTCNVREVVVCLNGGTALGDRYPFFLFFFFQPEKVLIVVCLLQMRLQRRIRRTPLRAFKHRILR